MKKVIANVTIKGPGFLSQAELWHDGIGTTSRMFSSDQDHLYDAKWVNSDKNRSLFELQ